MKFEAVVAPVTNPARRGVILAISDVPLMTESPRGVRGVCTGSWRLWLLLLRSWSRSIDNCWWRSSYLDDLGKVSVVVTGNVVGLVVARCPILDDACRRASSISFENEKTSSNIWKKNRFYYFTCRLREARSCLAANLASKSGSLVGICLLAARNRGTFFNGANAPGFGADMISNVSP